ncbi:hypothetical protein [Cupriavidus basilensis]|uniref:hypothetical protein n=1 Tax=Cupriavidus basilensis TaxID=68895 RepID=UPI00284567B4|nr:hypothetical protein [Cupriavidus basilensis]MDR3383074.1 hypothetical protein [Cupriavidus basilensis]
MKKTRRARLKSRQGDRELPTGLPGTRAKSHSCAALCLCSALLGFLSAPASAVLPDEIQVYTGDINAPGEFGLELHLNTTPSGHSQPSYPGEVTTPHGWRATAEFSYGLAPAWELGLYIPTMLSRDNTYYVTGPKLRVKWMPIRTVDGAGYFAGANVELARVGQKFESATKTLELRPIIGYQDRNWLFAFNPVLGWDLAGPDKSAVPSATPSFKVARTVLPGLRAGAEYYMDLGRVNHPATGPGQAQTIYLAFDVSRGPLVFNFGIGRGLSQAADRWTLKWIFEIPFS